MSPVEGTDGSCESFSLSAGINLNGPGDRECVELPIPPFVSFPARQAYMGSGVSPPPPSRAPVTCSAPPRLFALSRLSIVCEGVFLAFSSIEETVINLYSNVSHCCHTATRSLDLSDSLA